MQTPRQILTERLDAHLAHRRVVRNLRRELKHVTDPQRRDEINALIDTHLNEAQIALTPEAA